MGGLIIAVRLRNRHVQSRQYEDGRFHGTLFARPERSVRGSPALQPQSGVRGKCAVRWDVPAPDPHGFDGNRDGIGCES